MKVGILTFHRAVNYGAVLQAWALQTYLEKVGLCTYIVDYRCKYLENNYKIFSFSKFVKLSPKEKVTYLLSRILRFSDILKRNKAFDAFVKENIKTISANDLDCGDVVISGSDQVWNPKLTGGIDSMFLLCDKAIKSQRKIAYAISGEPKCFDITSLNTIEQYINHFESISFRESELKSLFSKLYNGTILECIDPTFLIDKCEWEKLASSNVVRKKYVFLFEVVHSDQAYKTASDIADALNAELIYLNARYSFSRKVSNIEFPIGPSEFVSLILNAEYVVTTSFHGTALSIILQKQFTYVKAGFTNRQESLLRKLNLLDRASTALDIINKPIEYSQVDMASFKKNSIEYLNRIKK